MTPILKYWAPAVFWTAIVLYGSGNALSAANTGDVLGNVIAFLLGRRPSPEQFQAMHFVIRKAAHLVAYFILGALYFRALRGEAGGWRGRWAAGAFALAAAVAITDEWRQMSVSSRTGSGWDVLLDCVGAAIAQGVTRWRTRISRFEVRMKN